MKNAVKEHGYNYNDQWLNDLLWNNTVYVWIFMILKMESKYWHNLKLYIIIDAWESNSQNLIKCCLLLDIECTIVMQCIVSHA